jgi:hypothetical protein
MILFAIENGDLIESINLTENIDLISDIAGVVGL